MTLTIFSLVLILAVALNVSKGVYDGYHNGSTKTIIAFLSVIISLVLGSILSSRVIAPLLSSLITSALSQTELFAFLFENISRLYVIVAAVISMVLSSIIFVIVFFVLRLICHLIVSTIYKKTLEQNGKKAEGSVGENDTWYKRNDKQIGAVVGGITGFLIVLILFSPIIGTLKSVDSVVSMITEGINNTSEQQTYSSDEDMREDEENSESKGALDVVSDYANDFAGTVMYYCGGKAIYDMNALVEIDGHTVVLSQEIESISSIARELFEVVPSIVDLSGFNSDHVEKLDDICETVDDSYFLSLVTSSIVSSASSSWSRGDDFIGFSRPDFNYSVSDFTNSIFSVLATTTPDTVGEDLSTIIRVCGIIMDSGILKTDGDYDEIMEILENSDFLNELVSELKKNPRTEPLIDSLHLFAMNSLMNTIKFDGYDVAEYNGLIENITEQFNRMNGQPHDKKVETLANYTVEYLQDYGVDVPDDVAKVIADAMITNIPNSDGYITTDQMQEFFEQYYQGNESR